MKFFFTVLCFLLTVSSLSAQENTVRKDPKLVVKAMSQAELQTHFQTLNTGLAKREAVLRTELKAHRSREDRQAKAAELSQVEQAMRNNRRILEGKAVQLGQAAKATN